MINIKLTQILAFVIFILAIKMYIDHRKKDYKGTYNPFMVYNNVSFLKHDLSKIAFVTLFFFLIYGLEEGEKFIDFNNILHSKIGEVFIIIMAYFIFDELIQSYILGKMPNFFK